MAVTDPPDRLDDGGARQIAWTTAEKAYGTAAVIPVIRTNVVNTVAPFAPA